MIATRTRRLGAAGAVVFGALLAAAPLAVADPVADATAQLAAGSLYVAPGINEVTIDKGLAAALPADLKIAVLPLSAGLPITLATDIARGLGASPKRPLTVGVVTVTQGGQISLRATSSKYCAGLADEQAQAAESAGRSQVLNTGDLTSTIEDFAQRLSHAPVAGGDCSTAANGAAKSGAGTVWVWVGAIAAVAAAGIGGLVLYRRRKRRDLDVARTAIAPCYDRLAEGR